MEEKKTQAEQIDSNAQVNLVDAEPVAAALEHSPGPIAAPAVKRSRVLPLTIVAIVTVAVVLTGLVYLLEKEGRLNTTLFSGLIASQATPVATVNGETITTEDLEQVTAQLTQTAIQQGANPNQPAVQESIRSQGLEIVIGTKLLLQTAAAQNITVTEEEVSDQLSQIEIEAGGEEALAARLEELVISPAMLEADVRSQLTITKLLETVTSELDIDVTEEEVNTAYENAGGPGSELPPLDDVRSQIEAQISQFKQQAAIDAYVTELRQDADIQITQ